MANAEYPPLGRSYVISYSNGDKDFPIIAIKKDPRVDNYKRPDDLSPHPDSTRYPNHVFTGTQPTNTDERVIWIYEILPSPWTPFTRYDDDLGPIQGRRRSVVNSGQEASLSRDKRVTYEAREGSAIVSTELEESWDAGSTDPDEPSPFPIKDRDFYDPSRGAVQERRQLVSTTGNEVATLENNNGIITQTSYEAYNEFLSFKIVQTYSVDGPLLEGKATDNDRQLVTVTTQRKASDNYVAPEPTATRTVEASREDAESIIERIVDTPEVFAAPQFQVSKPDIIPAKFRVAIPDVEISQSLEGLASTPQLSTNDISASAQQQNKFVVRTSRRSRQIERKEITSTQFTGELGGGEAEVKEILIPANSLPEEIELDLGLISSRIEDLGDGNLVKEVVKLKNEGTLPVLTGQEYDEALDIVVPYSQKFVKADDEESTTGERKQVNPRDVVHSAVREYDFEQIEETLDGFYWELPDMIQISLPNILRSVKVVFGYGNSSGSGSGVGDSFTYQFSRGSSINGNLVYDIEQGFNGTIPSIRAVFFLKKSESTPQKVLEVVQANSGVNGFFPNVRPEAHNVTILGSRKDNSNSESVSYSGASTSQSDSYSISVETASIPATIHGEITITEEFADISGSGSSSVSTGAVRPTSLPATQYSLFPTGKYLYSINSSPFRFGYTRIEAVILDITSEYVTPKETGG